MFPLDAATCPNDCQLRAAGAHLRRCSHADRVTAGSSCNSPAVALMYGLSTSGRFSRIGYNGDDNGTLRNVRLVDIPFEICVAIVKIKAAVIQFCS